jgi:nicotinamide-nucleotide amidase
MTVALLSIGTELVRGEVVNANAAWLADQLTQLGFDVSAIETVPDDRAQVVEGLRDLDARHAYVIVTGGLGPTSDDLTAAAAADAYERDLACNEDALAAIRRRVQDRGIEFQPGHEKQALLPRDAEILTNSMGTAPGFAIQRKGGTTFFLPGVPEEMRAMFALQVTPRVRESATHNVVQVCLHTYGAGETDIAARLAGIEETHPQVTLGYRVDNSQVDVKIIARDTDFSSAHQRVTDASRMARERLGELIYGEGDETLAQVAGRAVRNRGWRLAAAESCTGGLIAKMLTSQPASDYFVGGAVVYANMAKTVVLGVSEDTLRGHGAVSAEVAAEMAEGARRVFGADIALSTTGIAGPSGATSDKPLGLCYWAVAHPGGTDVAHKVFSGEREQVQKKAAYAALHTVRTIASTR